MSPARCHPGRAALFLLLILMALPVWADNLLIVRTHQPLASALENLKRSIREEGYDVARVDMVNIGLLGMGYTSSDYRAVFFGKAEELDELSRNYPQLVPYLPLRIAVFSEGDSTLLVTVDPSTYREFLDGAGDSAIFDRWREEISAILSRMTNR
ncbi:MAG TPA: hypothetical protein ENJ43_00130 [Gammaproteobacteria bacterium]|nr:hypothetical protein [Gammaproteobacteria bacterium]